MSGRSMDNPFPRKTYTWAMRTSFETKEGIWSEISQRLYAWCTAKYYQYKNILKRVLIFALFLRIWYNKSVNLLFKLISYMEKLGEILINIKSLFWSTFRVKFLNGSSTTSKTLFFRWFTWEVVQLAEEESKIISEKHWERFDVVEIERL